MVRRVFNPLMASNSIVPLIDLRFFVRGGGVWLVVGNGGGRQLSYRILEQPEELDI